jgi:hypothetical protein
MSITVRVVGSFSRSCQLKRYPYIQFPIRITGARYLDYCVVLLAIVFLAFEVSLGFITLGGLSRTLIRIGFYRLG